MDADDVNEEGDRTCLGSLEYLYVYYMKNLVTIWRGPMQKGSLSSLKSLTLRTCPKLTSIFTLELLDNLVSLVELSVEDCPAMVSLVSCTHSAHSETSTYLPMLKKLSLHYLPELSCIYSGLQVAPRIEWLSFFDCPNLRCLELSIKEVKRIRGQRNWWEALEWSRGRPENLDDIFVPIDASAVP
ncbi:hypothetical protein CDL15_Pgr027643 [Punica granatum]|nr:hypothetical protein CDL15_Pgr027643 [Punica granatum]